VSPEVDPARYVAAGDELVAVYREGFRGAATWLEGLEQAIAGLTGTLARDPELAQLCFMDVLTGGRELLQLREQRRRRFLKLLVDEHEWHHGPADRATRFAMEMVCAAIFQRISTEVQGGHAAQLDLHTAAVLAAARAFSPGECGLVASCRGGLGSLLRYLEEHAEEAWEWLAVWPSYDEPKTQAVRRRANAALQEALPHLDPRTLEDLWTVVHDRLWRDERPQLQDLRRPLLALDTLRKRGMPATVAELQAWT
jgi:hypothetical protein